MDQQKRIRKLLSDELVIALGCTEPISVAFAASLAKKYARGADITLVNVSVSRNVIKNAMGVTIPGTNHCGVDMAAALGIVAGDPEKKLEVLSGLIDSDIQKAEALIAQGITKVQIADSSKKLYIEVNIETTKSCAKVILADDHTRVSSIEVDGVVIFQAEPIDICEISSEKTMGFLNLESIWDFCLSVNLSDLEIVKQSIELNRKIAEEGLRNPYGLQVGRTMQSNIRLKILGDDIVNYAMSLTAAGTDARMAGSPMPVVSNSGSGNQGISATIPVVAVGERLGASEEKILRAVTLSHLIVIYIKAKFGRLSAICGAIVSCIGASCGIATLLGGGLEEVKMAIQNMLGNVTGMLCDGAKPGCALKVATCTGAAVQSALLAIRGFGIRHTDGIIETSPLHSIENLCRIGSEGTIDTDKIILEIMLNKQESKIVS
ncbi:L-cysteine desulfidase family protein [Dendrosporobacter sp. 1207_IL3150]|uniref:L-cysteine desulfidase family protein n=1 Tax=Dendrosporobacter sp. 1207_IL3150 TaxID=3084054 RepID=UPI002FDAFC3B